MTEHALNTSAKKLNMMDFQGLDPGTNKFVADNVIMQQVNSFNCFRKLIPYGEKVYIDNKLNNYSIMTGIISRYFRLQKL
jgi:hypothetical protein